jgi:hypothetical protein
MKHEPSRNCLFHHLDGFGHIAEGTYRRENISQGNISQREHRSENMSQVEHIRVRRDVVYQIAFFISSSGESFELDETRTKLVVAYFII